MKGATRWVLALIALQAALLGVYWLVEDERSPRAVERLGTAPPAHVDMAMPALTIYRRDGSHAPLRASAERATLVHVWATWCPPCRAELPGLLSVPERHPAEVVAIALDERWSEVERFLDGADASRIVRAHREEVARTLGIARLPVTFVVEPGGRIALRFDGARDWTDRAFVRSYLQETVGRH